MKMILKERAEFFAVRERMKLFSEDEAVQRRTAFFAGISLAYVVCRLRLRLRSVCAGAV